MLDPLNIKTEPLEPEPSSPPPKTSRKKKKKTAVNEGGTGDLDGTGKKMKQESITEYMPVRKKRDRFNGVPEEEIMSRTLPDHLAPDLDIVIIGINPGLMAAYVGHHYPGPGNHFWQCLFLSGLTPTQMNAYDDYKLKEIGIGFTNICARTTAGSADLKRAEIKEGASILLEKLQKYKPRIAAFNGKGIYEVFCGHKNFHIGKQLEPLQGTDTIIYVMPSSSARCAQLPRAADKLPFYIGLKKLRDHCRGTLTQLDDSEVIFEMPEFKYKVGKLEPSDADESGEVNVNAISAEDSTAPTGKAKRKRMKKEKLPSPPETDEDFVASFASVESSLRNSTMGWNGHQSIQQDSYPGHQLMQMHSNHHQVVDSPYGSMINLQRTEQQQQQNWLQQHQTQFQAQQQHEHEHGHHQQFQWQQEQQQQENWHRQQQQEQWQQQQFQYQADMHHLHMMQLQQQSHLAVLQDRHLPFSSGGQYDIKTEPKDDYFHL